jgi:hypothetical protein
MQRSLSLHIFKNYSSYKIIEPLDNLLEKIRLYHLVLTKITDGGEFALFSMQMHVYIYEKCKNFAKNIYFLDCHCFENSTANI